MDVKKGLKEEVNNVSDIKIAKNETLHDQMSNECPVTSNSVNFENALLKKYNHILEDNSNLLGEILNM